MDSSQTAPDNRVAVISAVLNEVSSVRPLVESLLSGSRVPEEIIIADGGSTDGTLRVLADLEHEYSEVRVIHDAGGRSEGRNTAIAAAGSDMIATIDAGCLPREDWLQKIVEPLNAGAEWVGGFYEVVGADQLSTAIGLTMVYVLEEAEGHFVPSARSMAFTKETWERAERFPEDLQFGEDSAFADNLMLQGIEPVFIPDAVVEWEPPANLTEQWRAMWNWGHGDGLAGLRSQHYKRLSMTFAAVVAGAILLGAIDYRLAPAAVLVTGPLIVEQTRPKYRHMTPLSKWLWIPIASLCGLAASLAGFLTGRRQRKKSERQ